MGLKEILSNDRKKVNSRAQDRGGSIREVFLVFDVLCPLDNASTIRLGVRLTPGKEKRDGM